MSKKINVDEVIIDGQTYVPKSELPTKAEPVDGMPYVIIRTYSAGVMDMDMDLDMDLDMDMDLDLDLDDKKYLKLQS